jgi:hypothetical protein
MIYIWNSKLKPNLNRKGRKEIDKEKKRSIKEKPIILSPNLGHGPPLGPRPFPRPTRAAAAEQPSAPCPSLARGPPGRFRLPTRVAHSQQAAPTQHPRGPSRLRSPSCGPAARAARARRPSDPSRVHGGLERPSAAAACLLAAWRSAARASCVHDQKTAHDLAWLTTTLPSCSAQPWRSRTTTPPQGRTSLASCSSSGGKHCSGRPTIPCEFFTSGKPRRPSSSQGEIPPTPSSLSFVDHPHAQTRVCLCCCAAVLRHFVLCCTSVRFLSLVRRTPGTASAKPSPA